MVAKVVGAPAGISGPRVERISGGGTRASTASLVNPIFPQFGFGFAAGHRLHIGISKYSLQLQRAMHCELPLQRDLQLCMATKQVSQGLMFDSPAEALLQGHWYMPDPRSKQHSGGVRTAPRVAQGEVVGMTGRLAQRSSGCFAVVVAVGQTG